MWMRYGIVLVTTLKKGSFQQLSHFVVVYASAYKRKVKIQSHVCNRLYTKESFGLYHSAFSQQHDYIMNTNIFMHKKRRIRLYSPKHRYYTIVQIRIIQNDIGRIVHSTNLCAYILTQKSKGRINHTSQGTPSTLVDEL